MLHRSAALAKSAFLAAASRLQLGQGARVDDVEVVHGEAPHLRRQKFAVRCFSSYCSTTITCTALCSLTQLQQRPPLSVIVQIGYLYRFQGFMA